MLVIGVALRQRFKPLRVLFIPGSVVAGFIGLLTATLCMNFGGVSLVQRVREINETLAGWPGPLIAVVFAAMLLQQPAGMERRPQWGRCLAVPK